MTPSSEPPGERETLVADDGQALVVERGLTKTRYRIDDRVAYETDAGTLIDGVLVWSRGPTEVYLPAGGRRRERTLLRAPRFLQRELSSGAPRRVFFQRLGGLWAVERPGASIVVRTVRGEPLEVARIDGGRLSEPNTDRAWHSLPEEQHVGRIALWAQVHSKLAHSASERALAEQVRVAAFAIADLPRATISAVRAHPAVRDRDLGPWAQWLARRASGPLRISAMHAAIEG